LYYFGQQFKNIGVKIYFSKQEQYLKEAMYQANCSAITAVLQTTDSSVQ